MSKRSIEYRIAGIVIKVAFFPLLVFMEGVDKYIELVATNETAFKLHATLTLTIIVAALIYRFFL
jgi:hypothetical protein